MRYLDEDSPGLAFRRWVCSLLGHRWVQPEGVFTKRWCDRCGKPYELSASDFMASEDMHLAAIADVDVIAAFGVTVEPWSLPDPNPMPRISLWRRRVVGPAT